MQTELTVSRELLEVYTGRKAGDWVEAGLQLRDLLDANVTDLDREDWMRILEAASQSTWMPPEYTRNDWVPDVCEFLKARPAHEAALQGLLNTADQRADDMAEMLRHFASCANVKQVGTGAMDFVAALPTGSKSPQADRHCMRVVLEIEGSPSDGYGAWLTDSDGDIHTVVTFDHPFAAADWCDRNGIAWSMPGLDKGADPVALLAEWRAQPCAES